MLHSPTFTEIQEQPKSDLALFTQKENIIGSLVFPEWETQQKETRFTDQRCQDLKQVIIRCFYTTQQNYNFLQGKSLKLLETNGLDACVYVCVGMHSTCI